jgi:hypothetical protein
MSNIGDMRVWWIPQVPGKAFRVPVASLEEGVKLLIVLADYDLFQYKNRIKPDYSNAGGIEALVKIDPYELPEWCDWYDEESGEDDPIKFVKEKNESKNSI